MAGERLLTQLPDLLQRAAYQVLGVPVVSLPTAALQLGTAPLEAMSTAVLTFRIAALETV